MFGEQKENECWDNGKDAQAPVATVTPVWRTIKTAHLSSTQTVNETPSLSTEAARGRQQTLLWGRIFTSVGSGESCISQYTDPKAGLSLPSVCSEINWQIRADPALPRACFPLSKPIWEHAVGFPASSFSESAGLDLIHSFWTFWTQGAKTWHRLHPELEISDESVSPDSGFGTVLTGAVKGVGTVRLGTMTACVELVECAVLSLTSTLCHT